MCVCFFSIEIQNAEWIAMKFGTEVILEGGKVLREVLAKYLKWVCVLFIEIQTAGQIWMKLGMEVVLKGGEGFWGSFSLVPSTPLVLGPKRGCLWSLSCSFWQKLYKTKDAGCLPS